MLSFLSLLAFFATQQPEPPPVFHSVGVRGGIDAGGYAASATSKAQNQFFDQLLQLQSTLQTKNCAGMTYEADGQFAAAAEAFRQAGERFAQSVALLLQGNIDDSQAVSRELLKQHPDGPGLLSLGAAFFQAGEVSKAIDLFLQAPAAYNFVAVAVRFADPPTLSRCVERLTADLRKSPQNAGAHYALACTLLAKGEKPSTIESHLQQALALNPKHAEAHFQLGELKAGQADLQGALAEYQAALTDKPDLIEVHYHLAHVYTRLGDQASATREFELHRKLRSEQKKEIEAGKLPAKFIVSALKNCQ